MSKLTAKARNKIPGKDFAGPDRSYPVQDENHTRNALARASQHASSGLKAKIRAKVHKKYPGIKMKMEGGCVSQRADTPRRK